MGLLVFLVERAVKSQLVEANFRSLISRDDDDCKKCQSYGC
jgi:hypothetical protein